MGRAIHALTHKIHDITAHIRLRRGSDICGDSLLIRSRLEARYSLISHARAQPSEGRRVFARPCRAHPRLPFVMSTSKTWMAGKSQDEPGHDRVGTPHGDIDPTTRHWHCSISQGRWWLCRPYNSRM